MSYQLPTDQSAFIERYTRNIMPTLDVYEQTLYIFLTAQALAAKSDEFVVGLKSARHHMGFGIGKAKAAPSERVVYERLRALEQKKLLRIKGAERNGTRIQLLPIEENPKAGPAPVVVSLEEIDFFTDEIRRQQIREREQDLCFYCFTQLTDENHVIEHVQSRPAGNNSYRNLVAACRTCNNKKGASEVLDFLRALRREELISTDEFSDRVHALEKLRAGQLVPPGCHSVASTAS